MAILTDEQLGQIEAKYGVIRRQNIVISGELCRFLTEKQRSFFRRNNRKTFAVLECSRLCCYESEMDWRRGRSPSTRILLSCIKMIECSPDFIQIGYTSGANERMRTLKLTADNRSCLSVWQELLQANLPGFRLIQNFAPGLQLSISASSREIVDCLFMAFPKPTSAKGICIHPNCESASGPGTKFCLFHKRIHADKQFRQQIGHIRRLLEDCRMDFEMSVIGIIADGSNDETLRRDAIVLLWYICSSSARGSFDLPVPTTDCERGGLKFMNHFCLLSQRQELDQVISDGILDVLLDRTTSDLGDCRVKRPGAWPALLAILATVQPDHRQKILHTINFLLIGNEYNCSTLASQNRWHSFIYTGLVANRAGSDMIVALSLNIFIMMSYNALLKTDEFVSSVNETLIQIQFNGGFDRTSLEVARAYLIGLCNKIEINVKFFPVDISSRPWIQSILFSNVVLRFLFRTADWGQVFSSKRQARMSITAKPLPIAQIKNRFRHAKHFHSVGNFTEKFPVESRNGAHEGDLHCDALLARRISSLHEKLACAIRDPSTLMDAYRDPYVVHDIELIRERFREISDVLHDQENAGRQLVHSVMKPLYLYH